MKYFFAINSLKNNKRISTIADNALDLNKNNVCRRVNQG